MTTVLFEGVLNNDIIERIADKTYRLTYWTYATCWSNHRHDIYFQSIENAMRYYLTMFPNRVFQQGKVWLEEDNEDADTPEEYWKSIIYSVCYA